MLKKQQQTNKEQIFSALNAARAVTVDLSCTEGQMCTPRLNAEFQSARKWAVYYNRVHFLVKYASHHTLMSDT